MVSVYGISRLTSYSCSGYVRLVVLFRLKGSIVLLGPHHLVGSTCGVNCSAECFAHIHIDYMTAMYIPGSRVLLSYVYTRGTFTRMAGEQAPEEQTGSHNSSSSWYAGYDSSVTVFSWFEIPNWHLHLALSVCPREAAASKRTRRSDRAPAHVVRICILMYQVPGTPVVYRIPFHTIPCHNVLLYRTLP